MIFASCERIMQLHYCKHIWNDAPLHAATVLFQLLRFSATKLIAGNLWELEVPRMGRSTDGTGTGTGIHEHTNEVHVYGTQT